VTPESVIASFRGKTQQQVATLLNALTTSEQEAVLALLAKVPDVIIQGNSRKLWTSTKREFFFAGPAECLAGETRIYNPLTGESPTIAELAEQNITPVVLTSTGVEQAEVPFIKDVAPLYRVTLLDGSSFIGTSRHLVLTQQGWTLLGDLRIGDAVPSSRPILPLSIAVSSPQASLPDAPHSSRTVPGSTGRYSTDCHPCGERPLGVAAPARDGSPSPVGVLERIPAYLPSGVRVTLSSRTRPPLSPARPASGDSLPHPVSTGYTGLRGDGHTPKPAYELYRYDDLSPQMFHLPPPSAQQDRGFAHTDSPSVASCMHYRTQYSAVSSITYERDDVYYDLTVPGAGHYFAQGMWHHNTSKTFTVCQRLHELALAYPRMRIVLTRGIYQDLLTSAIRTYREKIIRQDASGRSPYGVTVFGGERPEYFQYPNGSRIYTRGLDNSSSVLSEEWDIAAVCQAELLPGDTWTRLVTRTTGRAGNLPSSYKGPRLIGECNPGPPSHWILHRKETFPERFDFVELSHKDNPTLWDEAKGEWTEQGKLSIGDLQSLEGVDYQRLYLGLWVSAEGTVYDLQEAHLGTGLWQKGYPTQLAIDPSNGSGPYAALVIQQFDSRILVIDEFYKVGGTDEDFASWFKSTPYHEKLTDAISDPAKPDTIKRLSNLLKVPVRGKEGKKDITAQINSVKATMRQDPVTKQAPMVIDREKCPMLQDEFSQYVWQQAKDGGKNISSTPIDSHNHLLDAYAYWVTTKHLTGPQQHSILAEPTVEVVTGLAFR